MASKKMLTAGLAVLIAAALAATAALALSGATSATKRVVKTARVLGREAVVTRHGMTLYSLSAETHGRFICKNTSCLSLWHPLVVAKGTKPTGTSHLATIRRPDGRTQVTYRGKPLYTFVQDKRPGQAKGEGFKDVGTWHIAAVTAAKAPSGTMPQPTSTSPGYGY